MSESDALGMLWWNRLTDWERGRVLMQAFRILGDASPADAWRLWRAGRVNVDAEVES